MPGRVPMIVPPAAAKSSYYQAPIITQLWQEARIALQQPRVHLSLIGYSLPITDLVTSGMLREAAFGEPGRRVPVTIVNPDAQPVAERLTQLGVDEVDITVRTSVEAFVDDYEQVAAADLVDQLRSFHAADDDTLLLVGTHKAASEKVIGFEHQPEGTLVLRLEDNGSGHASITMQAPGAPPARTLCDLQDQLKGRDVRRLMTRRGPAAGRGPIVAAASYSHNTGMGNGNWQVLIPSVPLQA